MTENNLQPETPEHLNVIVTNISPSFEIVIIDKKTYRLDGVFTIEVIIGEKGQQLGLHEPDKEERHYIELEKDNRLAG